MNTIRQTSNKHKSPWRDDPEAVRRYQLGLDSLVHSNARFPNSYEPMPFAVRRLWSVAAERVARVVSRHTNTLIENEYWCELEAEDLAKRSGMSLEEFRRGEATLLNKDHLRREGTARAVRITEDDWERAFSEDYELLRASNSEMIEAGLVNVGSVFPS